MEAEIFMRAREVEEAREQLEAEQKLRQVQKMEAVGHLTGGIAHDFNNILTVITGLIDILAEAVEHDAALSSVTKMISDAAFRGAEVTKHLLAFSRQQPLQPREANLNTLVQDTAALAAPSLGEQIEIDTALRAGRVAGLHRSQPHGDRAAQSRRSTPATRCRTAAS